MGGSRVVWVFRVQGLIRVSGLGFSVLGFTRVFMKGCWVGHLDWTCGIGEPLQGRALPIQPIRV